jgi:hypothetical protein
VSVANCPGCGAPIEFAIGSAIVRICEHCRSAVARTDRDLQNLGRVADLIDTGSPLRVQMAGRYQGTGFRLTGRVQLRHDSGAIWDEWYAAFDDGRWGWLDEADGNYYVTFETREADAPAAQSLKLGDVFEGMTVFEIGTAEVVSAEGEMPWRAAPGATYTYADLSGAGGRFATIEDLDRRVVVFKGKETSLSGLGLETQEVRPKRVGGAKLSCSQCGGILNVLSPESERIACVHCGAIHEIKPGSLLEFVTSQKKFRNDLTIPLGSTGKFDKVPYVVAGFLRQQASGGGERWSWDEYLLFNPETGFRYLTCDADHWSLEDPILPGDIEDPTPTDASTYIRYKGKRFRLFEKAKPSVKLVLGEFPWRVEVGESVKGADYVAPPFGVSKELYEKNRSRESNYSVAHYLTVGEVESAFGITGLPRPKTIGAMQPNPWPLLVGPWMFGMIALLFLAVVVGLFTPKRVVWKGSFEVHSTKPFTSPPFRLEGNRHLVIRGFSPLAVGEETTVLGEIEGPAAEAFDLWMAFESGFDDEGAWTEDSRRATEYLPGMPAGEYTANFTSMYVTPRTVDVEIQEGAFRWSHLLLAAIAISALPLLLGLLHVFFESKRWQDSDYSPFPESDDE